MLYMVIGLPFSGKTAWAKAQNVPIVNVDAIRFAIHGSRFSFKFEDLVWFHAKLMVECLQRAGHKDVILDATNIQAKSRNGWAQLFDVAYVVFTPPVLDCKARAIKCGRPEMVQVIDRMYNDFEIPAHYFKGDTFNIRDNHAPSKLPADEVSVTNQPVPVLPGPAEVLRPVSGANSDSA